MFGHQTAEFLICRRCGVYVAAVTAEPNPPRAILQVKILDAYHHFSEHAIPVDYADEGRVSRLERRREVWMPAVIETG